MRIGVIGAGIQGCCSALQLAERGFEIDLFDLAAAPMDGASRWNEGKIHLGYVYANDKSLATARAMIASACQFDSFFRETLGQRIPVARQSSRFIYGVHRDSLIRTEQVQSYFHSVDCLLKQALATGSYDYLGETFSSHVNPIFWRLHGWVDDRIEDWFKAQESVRPGAVKRRAMDGIDWFEADKTWVLVDEPWEGLKDPHAGHGGHGHGH